MDRGLRTLVRGTAYEELFSEFHTFRRLVATAIAQEYGAQQAAAQLGHRTTQMTEQRYIARRREVQDLTSAFDDRRGESGE